MCIHTGERFFMSSMGCVEEMGLKAVEAQTRHARHLRTRVDSPDGPVNRIPRVTADTIRTSRHCRGLASI